MVEDILVVHDCSISNAAIETKLYKGVVRGNGLEGPCYFGVPDGDLLIWRPLS